MRFLFRPSPAFLRSVVGGIVFLLILSVGPVPAQGTKLSPGETVLQFYRLLREKKYIEAFRLHVCAPAVETLSGEEAATLQDEFEKIAGGIPEKIELGGESVLGNDATVFVKVPSGEKINGEQPYVSVPVGLILSEGKWLIGDRDTQALAYFHKSKFFSLSKSGVFSVMLDNEEKAAKAISALIEIEQFFARNHRGAYGTLQELVAAKNNNRSDLAQMLEQLEDGEFFGYRFEIELPEDRKSYILYATPIQQNIDGRYSYIADLDGVKFRNYGGQKLQKNMPGLSPLNEKGTNTTVTTSPAKPQ